MNTEIEIMQIRSLSLSEAVLSFVLRNLPIKHGKHRLLDKLFPSSWNTTSNLVRVKVEGKSILIDMSDLVGWHLAILRSFDPEVIEIIEAICNPNGEEVLWDIGSNKRACFCMLASRITSLRVVAIEPQKDMKRINLINLDSLFPGRHEYFEVGISDSERQMNLIVPKTNTGRASLHLQPNDSDNRVEVINVLTAKQIAEKSKFGWPSVVKIDVEGHESAVLRSLAPAFRTKTCKAVVFENHRAETVAFRTALEIGEENGYRIYGIQKSPWFTTLVYASKQIIGVTDYAMLRTDLLEKGSPIVSMIRNGEY